MTIIWISGEPFEGSLDDEIFCVVTHAAWLNWSNRSSMVRLATAWLSAGEIS